MYEQTVLNAYDCFWEGSYQTFVLYWLKFLQHTVRKGFVLRILNPSPLSPRRLLGHFLGNHSVLDILTQEGHEIVHMPAEPPGAAAEWVSRHRGSSFHFISKEGSPRWFRRSQEKTKMMFLELSFDVKTDWNQSRPRSHSCPFSCYSSILLTP